MNSFIETFLHPADSDTKKLLDEKWTALPSHLRTDQQMYGVNEEGCGATVGAMPVCDFACKACYLADYSANKTPVETIDNIEKQIILLRKHLGRWGNLQITDGEVTLRSEDELHEMVRLAIKHELIPMIMTHGDTFRFNPDLLYRLVKDSGLREVSFHVDTTQRGRKGAEYKNAKTEKELMPLRDEFVELIKSVKKETSHTLRAASTVTVTKDNFSEVPDIVRWYSQNSDVFRLLSFQPVADVGRTIDDVAEAVSVDSLWEKIEEGLGRSRFPSKESKESQWWMGHSECSRFIFGYVFKSKDNSIIFRRLTSRSSDIAKNVILGFYRRWPGLTFRADTKSQAIARALGMLFQHPLFLLKDFTKLMFSIFREVSGGASLKLLLNIARKKTQMNRLTIVSHHFMSKKQIESKIGAERIDSCIFKIPYKDKLISMCEFNAMGYRESYYQELRDREKPLEKLC